LSLLPTAKNIVIINETAEKGVHTTYIQYNKDMTNKLSKQERAGLINQHRQTRDKRVCDRIKAVLAFDDGYTYKEIAKILLLDDSTIRRHLDDYFHNNRKLHTDNGGSTGYLNMTQSKQLILHLRTCTYLYVKNICAYVSKNYGKKYTIAGMTKWLRRHGFTHKKPQPIPAKANAVEQQKFVEYYDKIKKKADNEPIYFADSVHPQHQTRLAYGWIFKGDTKYVPTNGKQKRLNIIGGINLSGHKIEYTLADTINFKSIKNFLRHLRLKNKGTTKLHVIWDNAGYHKHQEVQSFAKKLNIKLHYLPPYSPNLNPIERLWKVMHEYVTYNKYYGKFKEFEQAILKFFKTIGKKKKLLRARINDNFNLLQSPILASSG
jgi:transposase